jgi:hypothetical protein
MFLLPRLAIIEPRAVETSRFKRTAVVHENDHSRLTEWEEIRRGADLATNAGAAPAAASAHDATALTDGPDFVPSYVTPGYLAGLHEGRMSIQAKALLDPFVGMKMRIVLSVTDVHKLDIEMLRSPASTPARRRHGAARCHSRSRRLPALAAAISLECDAA